MSMLYNSKVKERYLSEVTENIHTIFVTTSIQEMILQKDLYDFDVEDFRIFNFPTGHLELISEYISWSIRNALKMNNFNTVDLILLDDEED